MNEHVAGQLKIKMYTTKLHSLHTARLE